MVPKLSWSQRIFRVFGGTPTPQCISTTIFSIIKGVNAPQQSRKVTSHRWYYLPVTWTIFPHKTYMNSITRVIVLCVGVRVYVHPVQIKLPERFSSLFVNSKSSGPRSSIFSSNYLYLLWFGTLTYRTRFYDQIIIQVPPTRLTLLSTVFYTFKVDPITDKYLSYFFFIVRKKFNP